MRDAVAWIIDMALNFVGHAAFGLLLLAVLLIVAGRPRLAGLMFLPALVGFAWVLVAHGHGLPLGSDVSGIPLRVMTFNLLAPSRDFDHKRALIRDQDADIVFLQEVNPQWWQGLADLRQRYPHVRREGPIGVAILSRHPLGETEGVLTHTWPRNVPRPSFIGPDQGIVRAIRLQARVQGRPVTLINFHAAKPTSFNGYRRRRSQFREIASDLNEIDGPVLVGGDFNAAPTAPSLQRLIRTAGLDGLPLRPFKLLSTWPSFLPAFGIQIDHLLSRGLALKDYRVLRGSGSNHRPVVADYVLAPRGTN